MNDLTLLAIVKARLNRLQSDNSLDAYLEARIRAAEEQLNRNGIRLNQDSMDDMMLVADYTVWAYQNRDSAGTMPEWLRLQRRERFLKTEEMQ